MQFDSSTGIVNGDGNVNVAALIPDLVMPAEVARQLTDEVKKDAAQLWTKLLRLYEHNAHLALGYTSWGAYYSTEFGQTGRTGYRLLDAARVRTALGPSDTHVTLSQNQARALLPLIDQPEEMRAALLEAVEAAEADGGQMSVLHVKRAIAKRLPPELEPEVEADADTQSNDAQAEVTEHSEDEGDGQTEDQPEGGPATQAASSSTTATATALETSVAAEEDGGIDLADISAKGEEEAEVPTSYARPEWLALLERAEFDALRKNLKKTFDGKITKLPLETPHEDRARMEELADEIKDLRSYLDGLAKRIGKEVYDLDRRTYEGTWTKMELEEAA